MDNQTHTPSEPDYSDRDFSQNIEAPIGATAEAIAKRIEAERARLANEEAMERDLTLERKRLLTQGTDKETDDVERRIDCCRGTQVRILERVDLLIAELHQANAIARKAHISSLLDEAKRARDLGITLLAEYEKSAIHLADIAGQLEAVNTIIRMANAQAHQSGHTDAVDLVDDADGIGLALTIPALPVHAGAEHWSPGSRMAMLAASGFTGPQHMARAEHQDTSIAKVRQRLAAERSPTQARAKSK